MIQRGRIQEESVNYGVFDQCRKTDTRLTQRLLSITTRGDSHDTAKAGWQETQEGTAEG